MKSVALGWITSFESPPIVLLTVSWRLNSQFFWAFESDHTFCAPPVFTNPFFYIFSFKCHGWYPPRSPIPSKMAVNHLSFCETPVRCVSRALSTASTWRSPSTRNSPWPRPCRSSSHPQTNHLVRIKEISCMPGCLFADVNSPKVRNFQWVIFTNKIRGQKNLQLSIDPLYLLGWRPNEAHTNKFRIFDC